MIGKKCWLTAVVAGMVAFVGCKPDEEIRTYSVEKEPEKPVRPDESGEGKMRMLAAIIPTGENLSYFVRFLGTAETVAPYEADFEAFVKSIVPSADPKVPMTWTIPAGWKLGKAMKERVVTLTPIAGPETVVMYISQPFGGTMLMNVNRWRTDFLGTKPIAADELDSIARPVQLGATKAFIFDLRGPGGTGRMGGPMSGKN